MSDAAGTRRQALMFRRGRSHDGYRQQHAGAQRHERAGHRFTVGPNGPASMPAELPVTSGYTYAFEASVDEAVAAAATSVQFISRSSATTRTSGTARGGIVPSAPTID